MYEHKSEPLLTRAQFLRRVLLHGGITAALVGVSLLVGIAGYMYFAQMTLVDAFVNSAMLLGGMGPVGDLPTGEAKVFAGVYALYAGLIFIIGAGVLVAPIAHRIFHKLHLDAEDPDARPARKPSRSRSRQSH